MSLIVVIEAGVIIFLAGILQSAVGFGFALFATPLLLWIGIPLPNVIALVATCSMLQAIIGSGRLKASVPWRLSFVATAVRLSGMAFGIFLLKRLVMIDIAHIRMVIGIVICVLVIAQMLMKPEPAKTTRRGWAAIAFTVSGVLVGLCGMGGPPLVLWAVSHNWSTQKIRGFLFAVFAETIPVQIIVLGITFGTPIFRSAALGLLCLPILYGSTLIGIPLGNRMRNEWLRTVAYSILLVIGLSAVIPVVL